MADSELSTTVPLDLGDLILRGRDVLLRPLERDDAPALAVAASDSREHYRYNPVPEGLIQTKAYIERAMRQRANGKRHAFTILWKGRVAGSTSYAEFQPWEWPPGFEHQSRRDRPDALEIGYTWLAASAQRTRSNTEAKQLLINHAFDAWNVHRVSLRTDERNLRSRRAIERLGAKFDGLRRGNMPGTDGTVRTSAYFSILVAEWPVVKARLQKLLEGTGAA